MASKIQSVADALVSQIETGEAAGTFSKSIVTESRFDTALEMEDTETVSVLVVPMGSNLTRKSEGTFNRDCILEVMVRKRFASSDFDTSGRVPKELVDEYVELLEQIDEYLADPDNHKLTTYPEAVYIEDDSNEADRNLVRELGITVPWEKEHLQLWQQYTGVLRVGYHVEGAY